MSLFVFHILWPYMIRIHGASVKTIAWETVWHEDLHDVLTKARPDLLPFYHEWDQGQGPKGWDRYHVCRKIRRLQRAGCVELERDDTMVAYEKEFDRVVPLGPELVIEGSEDQELLQIARERRRVKTDKIFPWRPCMAGLSEASSISNPISSAISCGTTAKRVA